jgi:hypothetical protein
MPRQTDYDEEIADRLCEEIAAGAALYRLCAESEELPAERTVYQWLQANPAFAQKYARARERQQDREADRIVEIADSAEDANLARLQIDARKWRASKLAPKKYGDRVQAELSGPDGGPIRTQVDLSKLDADARAALRAIATQLAEDAEGGSSGA